MDQDHHSISYLPTPQQIEAKCLEIQSSWSERQRHSRTNGYMAQGGQREASGKYEMREEVATINPEDTWGVSEELTAEWGGDGLEKGEDWSFGRLG